MRWSASMVSIAGIALLCACSSRGITKPRSEVLEEAADNGLYLPSVEEDRAAFYGYEDAQRRRLLALVKRRANPEFRDTTYRLGPGDELEINVFDVPELNLTAQVRQSGFISLPLLGAVKAEGKTESELANDLRHRLTAFVRNPEISIFITNYSGHRVAVMGAVRQPGSYSLKKGSNSILELLSQAGGVSEKAANLMLFIPADYSGVTSAGDLESRTQLALASANQDLKSSAIEIYLDQVFGTGGGIPLDIPVRGGDMIVVPEAGKVMVEGEVEKPGSYDLGQQFTLLSALAAAGGITYGAKFDEVEIVRDLGLEGKLRLVLDLEKMGTGEEKDVRLKNGDIVRVPSHSGRRMRQDTFDSITKLINFGIGGSVNLAK